MMSVPHNVTVGRSYADVAAGRFNSNVTNNSTQNFVPSLSNAPVTSHQNAQPITETGINTDAAPSKSSLFSKFKALLCKVAQAPIAFASKIGRALQTTAKQVATWATFRKVLIRVTCVATIIGISGTVAAMTANPALGGSVGMLLGVAAQEILSTSISAFINDGIFA